MQQKVLTAINQDFEEEHYNLDVIEVSNLALAIKNKEPTVNYEISLGCQNLPEVDLFGLTDPMIVCFKKQPIPNSEEFQLTEIGRTEIIPNELNPRFIKTFILSYNEERLDYIEFQIYDIDKFKFQDLKEHNLIGRVETTVREIVEAETLIKQIDEVANRKAKSFLKVTSAEYDGGNSKYEIALTANGLSSRHDIFFKLEVYRLTEWVPIYCSDIQESFKQVKFQPFELPSNKFSDDDKNRVRIRFYEFNESKGQIEIGSTDDLFVSDLLLKNNKQHSVAIVKDSLPVGSLLVIKFNKIVRDSFISYIVNGAKLHLIVAVDFTKTENQIQSLHTLHNDSNEYIEAMRQIIGLLQYFDYYNQMAFYGFGAKLPPFYNTVGQCFALNGDFFNPTVVGGVEELIKIYKENLQKVKLHGPAKFSEVFDLAREYSLVQAQSSDYYVLVLFTEGNISDEDDLIERLVKASQLPLSVLLIGVGSGDFPLLRKLDSDDSYLMTRNGDVAKRDIVHFIPFNLFNKQNGRKNIARQVFAQLPKQFIEYMKSKDIKPNKKNNKALKNAKSDYIAAKIGECRKLSLERSPFVVYNPKFLTGKKAQLKDTLISLGFQHTTLLTEMKIALNDINYYIEVEASMKKQPLRQLKPFRQLHYLREVSRLDEFIEKKQKLYHKKTLMKLEKAEANQYGRRLVRMEPKPRPPERKIFVAENPCLVCGERQINVMYAACGHICCCEECEQQFCQVCRKANVESYRLC